MTPAGGARSGSYGTSAPSGRGRTTRCRRRVIANGRCLHDNGGRVMLVAHSQGAALATAALVQPECRPEGDYPALITFGSPVCKLYSWGFPAYFNRKLLAPLERGGAGR